MRAVDNARSYDWQSWMLGIMRSFLSGGAAALLTGGGSALVGIPPRQAWVLMGINFISMGLYRMGEFLQLHGAPDQVQKALESAAEETSKAVVQASKADAAVHDAKSKAETNN